MRRFLGVAATAGVLLLAGCGGGGGDGGGGGGGATPLVYSGNSSAAVISATNAGTLTAVVMGGGSTTPNLSVVGAAGGIDTGLGETAHRLARGVRKTLPQSIKSDDKDKVRLAISVDQTDACAGGGTSRIFGTVNDDGTGTVSIVYSACRTDDQTLDGSGSLVIHAPDFSDFTIHFTRATLSAPGVNVSMSGSARLHLVGNVETATLNLVVLNSITGRMSKGENLIYVTTYNDIFSPSSYTEVVTGRIYDFTHGFVDVATLVPLIFNTLSQEFPNGGVLELAGSNSGRIRVTAQSAVAVALGLDLDANSIFEIAATLGWTDLSGAAGADLADADGDGMHNSWEVAKGLNPNDPGDALLDPDGDGAGNLSEYLAATDPSSGSSTPASTFLSIAATDSPDPAITGSQITYLLTVVNSGTAIATNVVVTDTLPSGGTLVSATASQGACLGSAPVQCNLGNIAPATAATVTIVVAPTSQGTYVNTATVTTSSLDSNTSDDTAISSTTVGGSAAGIQATVDATPDGGIVDVPPGTYFGTLDLRNRNIVLQSTDGPAATTLRGNSGSAILMGPGSVVRGFTITGGFATFGGGINVFGSGSVIAANVFDSNVQSSGGGGAAIWGNSASPTIEGNVFRHHVSCSGGVVSFVNVSSPVIRNNVFHNNACPALHFVTPAGNTSQVINNTFVGNNIAIYLDRRVPHTTDVYRNNLLAFNQVGWHVEVLQGTTDADNPVWQNNLMFGNTVAHYSGAADQTDVNGNIIGDPRFVDAPSANYRVDAGSAAIDTGSAIGAPTSDFDGTARPQGAGIDIGAFERVP